MMCFEIETQYKNGDLTEEVITSKSEKKMWEIYDKSHNNEEIEYSAIIDAWPA